MYISLYLDDEPGSNQHEATSTGDEVEDVRNVEMRIRFLDRVDTDQYNDDQSI